MSRLDDYIDVLRLDNIVPCLTTTERLQVSQYRAGWCDDVPAKVKILQNAITSNEWDIPEFRYSIERELKWLDNGIPRSLQNFPKEEMNKFKRIIQIIN